MNILKITAKAHAGKLSLDLVDRKRIACYLDAREGKKTTLVLQPGDAFPSDAQRNFFHGVVIVAATRATGHACPEWWKAKFKSLFLSKQITNPGTGEIVLWVRSTESLALAEYSAFIDRSIQYIIDELGGFLTEDERHDYAEVSAVREK